MAAKAERKLKVVADNRKARFNYFIDDTMDYVANIEQLLKKTHNNDAK